jgi:hemoglobin/transferrin/lactoferrin receptor protein
MKMDRLKYISLLLLGVTAASGAAVENTDADESLELEPVVVIASKHARPLIDVVGSVTVFDAQMIARQRVENIDDLLRYEPSLSTDNAGTRFGTTGINIRGIGDNRVLMEIDGVPFGDSFDVGSFSNAGRDLLDTDLIKRVEILNGPASTLYGSDAIGGVMSVTTRDPQDLLMLTGGDTYFGSRLGYDGENESIVAAVSGAWSGAAVDSLVHLTHRSGSQADNQAAAGFADDARDWDSNALLAKLVWSSAAGNTVRLGIDSYQAEGTTDIQSLLGRGRYRSTTLMQGDDESERSRLSLDYSFTAGEWFDSASARVYYTENKTRQQTTEERTNTSRPVRRERLFDYRQDLAGLELTAVREFTTDSAMHHLVAGLEYEQTDSREFRDGIQTNLLDGSQTNSIVGEVFPVRDFPLSDTTEWGLFVQDEIVLDDSRWTLVPAVRFDRYKLSPRADAMYLEDNPSTTIVSLSDSAVSPKLGVLYRINDQWRAYAQYVRGFRAPPFEDANIGLDLALFKYRAIPNPDLKSETSDGFELGIRQMDGDSSFTVTAFYTNYDDFIETKARIGLDPESGYLLFQSRNIDTAKIYGAELSWRQALATYFDGLEGISAEVKLYWARGENKESGQPLNSVGPPQAITALSWHSDDQRTDVALTGTFARPTTRVDESGGDSFKPPGYGIADLVAGYAVSPRVSIRAGIFNITDKKYWRANEVISFTPDDPVVEILSRPGRTYSLSISGRF